MKRIACLLFILAISISCAATPERRATSSNPEVRVVVVATFDGITLYRVDAGDHDVFVAVKGNSLSTENWVPCGKGCVRNEDVQTVNR